MADQSSQPVILIIDQDPFVCDLLQHFLSRCGYRIEVAKDVPEAIRAAIGCAPDLILVDPEIDGIDTLPFLKDVAEAGAATTIVMTLNADRDFILEATRVGACDFYLKSDFSCEELKRKIEGYLSGQPSANDSESSDETVGAAG